MQGLTLCRWRNQKGKIPDMDELEAKKAQLMEKLDIKREAAFEKDLILEELASLSTRLHESAAAGIEHEIDAWKHSLRRKALNA